jgi:hypothetical protein
MCLWCGHDHVPEGNEAYNILAGCSIVKMVGSDPGGAIS